MGGGSVNSCLATLTARRGRWLIVGVGPVDLGTMGVCRLFPECLIALVSKVQELSCLLEDLYVEYNRRRYVSPDPLEWVYRYEAVADREVAGLVAASLAYGRVESILNSVERVMTPMGESPCAFLCNVSRAELDALYSSFKHRWTTSDELVEFLAGIGQVINEYGSLERCFGEHHGTKAQTTQAGLAGFVDALGACSSLLSNPTKNSACKRLHLYLRWMVRHDDVDPGCWSSVSPSQLIVPLDTHMFTVGKGFGFTERKQPNMQAALDITEAFRVLCREDPLRYDFVLTRFGIRRELDMKELLSLHR